MLIGACQPAAVQDAPSPAPAGWEGRWTGPEGTYLQLTARPGEGYAVAIRNLDGERTFDGTVKEGKLQFARDGRQEQLTATDGAGTGMKWLADKKTCLTVRPGEGYCRD